jgi:hypothetical protein
VIIDANGEAAYVSTFGFKKMGFNLFGN